MIFEEKCDMVILDLHECDISAVCGIRTKIKPRSAGAVPGLVSLNVNFFVKLVSTYYIGCTGYFKWFLRIFPGFLKVCEQLPF